MRIGYAIVHLASGEILAKYGELPATLRIPDTKTEFLTPILGAEIADVRIVECWLATPVPETRHQVLSETEQFDGERVVVTREYENLPPPRRMIEKALVLERLTDAQLEHVLGLLTPRQKERWRMPGHPQVYVDDPDLLQVLQVVGADPAVVLAP